MKSANSSASGAPDRNEDGILCLDGGGLAIVRWKVQRYNPAPLLEKIANGTSERIDE
ncbi:hypothetical protein Pan14r_51410 [Crateriforma conspicua]|uniref:Uncharacterized protein n=1 Tax=Crateriforma conspicua TaxID=2527996 RepID=A0A5C5XRR9_9PLAN|nr:hypothetical protein Pan14r_51410 [Crateriforma conspicua]